MHSPASEFHAVLLRDRGVRMGAVDEHARDLGRLGVLEELPWLLGSSDAAPDLFVSGPGQAALGLHPTWFLELHSTSLHLVGDGHVLHEWHRDVLPEDWFSALLRRGRAGLVLSAELPSPYELPSAMEEVLAATASRAAYLGLRLAPAPVSASALAARLWDEKRVSNSGNWPRLTNPEPPTVSLPSSPLPAGFVPSLRNLADAGLPVDDFALDKYSVQRDQAGVYHMDSACAGQGSKYVSTIVQEILRSPCPRCTPGPDSPISEWKSGALSYEPKELLQAVGLNDRLQHLRAQVATLPAYATPPAGFAPVPVGDGYGLALQLVEVELAANRAANGFSRGGRNLPAFLEVARRSREVLDTLTLDLQRRSDPTAERALLLARFTPAALSQTDPRYHSRLAAEFTAFLERGLDPLGHAGSAAQISGAPLDVTTTTFSTWLTELDRGRVTLAGQLSVMSVETSDWWPESPLLRLALLRWGRRSLSTDRHTLLVVPAPVSLVLSAMDSGLAKTFGPLWPGEDSASLVNASRSFGKYAVYNLEKHLDEARRHAGLLDPAAPVGYRPLDELASQGSPTQYEGRRR